MEQAWKRASLLFTASALVYGFALIVTFIQWIGELEGCVSHPERPICDLVGVDLYYNTGAFLIALSLTMVSNRNSKSIKMPNQEYHIVTNEQSNSKNLILNLISKLFSNRVETTTHFGGYFDTPVFYILGYFLFASNVTFFIASLDGDDVWSPLFHLSMQVFCSIFFLVVYRGEFFKGVLTTSITASIFGVLSVFSLISESITLLVVSMFICGGILVFQILKNVVKGNQKRLLGMFYGAGLGFVLFLIMIVLTIDLWW